MSISATVTYVSDNTFDCMLVQEILRRAFPETCFSCVPDGQEFLSQLQTMPRHELPKAIVMDFFCAGMSGYRLAGHIRSVEGCEKIPFIFLGDSLSPFVEELLASTTDAIYVHRSMDLEQMERDIEQALRRALQAPG